MFARASVKTAKYQQGIALLVIAIIFVLAFNVYIFSDLSISQVRFDKTQNSLQTLKKAKQAVINYAVTYADRAIDNDYGILPNPETFLNGNDGNMAGAAGAKNTNAVGWLPWRSLDLPNLKDESGTCLFYAVSGTYKLGPRADMVNEDSIGMFRVLNSDGTVVQGGSVDSQVVALVIAPGAPLPGQVRNPSIVNSNCGRDYAANFVSDYLEGNGVYDNSSVSAVADTIDDFIHATETSATAATPYNDIFLTINREEIWDAIVKRNDFKIKMENLTHGLAMCLVEYSKLTTNRRLPWPVVTDLGDRTNYRDNNNYVDTGKGDIDFNGYSGRYPFNVANSNAAIDPATLTEDKLFNIAGLCDSLDVGGGVTVDLETTSSEYRKLWDNWKDHFFYVLSKKYEPDNLGAIECSVPNTCIKVNATEYAAAIIFSGSRLAGVTRNDKSVVADYLEDGKAADFDIEKVNKLGKRAYIYTDPQTDTENDIMFCIRDQPTGTPLDVIECL